jgi:hypothetical protein
MRLRMRKSGNSRRISTPRFIRRRTPARITIGKSTYRQRAPIGRSRREIRARIPICLAAAADFSTNNLAGAQPDHDADDIAAEDDAHQVSAALVNITENRVTDEQNNARNKDQATANLSTYSGGISS